MGWMTIDHDATGDPQLFESGCEGGDKQIGYTHIPEVLPHRTTFTMIKPTETARPDRMATG